MMRQIILFLLTIFLSGSVFGDRISDKIDKVCDEIKKDSDKYYSCFDMNSHPMYSPDGRYSVFTASIGIYTNKIYLMDISSNQMIKVINSPDFIDVYCVLSRDMKRLLYLKTTNGLGKKDYVNEIILMDLKTGEKKIIYNITNISIQMIRFSYDESKIYFVRWDNPGKRNSGRRIYCVGTNGQKRIRMENRLYFDIDNMVSLPDNKTIVYSAKGNDDRGYSIFKANEDIRKEETVLQGSFVSNFQVIFSYNYSNFIYSALYNEIYKIPLDGQEIKLIPFVKIPDSNCNFLDLNLSKDGKKILFNKQIWVTLFTATNILMEVNLEGTEKKAFPITREDLMKAEVYKVE